MNWYDAHTCKVCGHPLKGKRYDAVTCSPACRKAYSRRKEEADRRALHILDQISTLEVTMKKYPDLDVDIRNWLRQMRNDIDAALSN